MRLQGAMREDFPLTARAAGDEEFARLVKGYLTAHPSRSYTLRDLGGQFGAWLSQQESKGFCAPEWVDIAKFEWAHIEAFDAAELERPGDHLQPEDLKCISLQPNVRLISTRKGLFALLPDEARAAQRGLGTRFVVVFRKGFSTTHVCLAESEFLMLQLVGRSTDLHSALAKAVEKGVIGPSNTKDAHFWLLKWSFQGWLGFKNNGGCE